MTRQIRWSLFDVPQFNQVLSASIIKEFEAAAPIEFVH